MVDNVTRNATSGGAVIATDDVSGVHYQVVKLAFGALDTATLVTQATRLPVASERLAAARGDITGLEIVRAHGLNSSVSSSNEEDIWNSTGLYPFPQVVETVRVKAGGDVNDTAAGSGARKVTVEGLDGALAQASADLVTAGASASAATSTQFARLFRAFLPDDGAGTYTGNNTGLITIENTTALVDLAFITADKGESEMAMYTIPISKTGFLTRVYVEVEGSQSADVNIWQRPLSGDLSAPFGPRRLISSFPGLTGEHDRDYDSGVVLAAQTDVWLSAISTASTTRVSAEFDLILVDD